MEATQILDEFNAELQKELLTIEKEFRALFTGRYDSPHPPLWNQLITFWANGEIVMRRTEDNMIPDTIYRIIEDMANRIINRNLSRWKDGLSETA